MSARIFISYRREDSLGSAGRIYDHLVDYFGRDQIFMDVDTIQPGLDFVKVIDSTLNDIDILIAVIGPSWLTVKDVSGNLRLDNPEDFVRLEIATALKRDIRVIPVLVEGASPFRGTDLPDDLRLLARRNAIEISHNRFTSDIQRLVSALKIALADDSMAKSQQETKEVDYSINSGQRSEKHKDSLSINAPWWQSLLASNWFGVVLPIFLLAYYYLALIIFNCANQDVVLIGGVVGFLTTLIMLIKKQKSLWVSALVIAGLVFIISLPHGEFYGTVSSSTIFNLKMGSDCQQDTYEWVDLVLTSLYLTAFSINFGHIKFSKS